MLVGDVCWEIIVCPLGGEGVHGCLESSNHNKLLVNSTMADTTNMHGI